MSDEPVMNTDRELWRERPGDYYADSIHVTADGKIGINCGEHVFVMPVREWHALAKAGSGDLMGFGSYGERDAAMVDAVRPRPAAPVGYHQCVCKITDNGYEPCASHAKWADARVRGGLLYDDRGNAAPVGEPVALVPVETYNRAMRDLIQEKRMHEPPREPHIGAIAWRIFDPTINAHTEWSTYDPAHGPIKLESSKAIAKGMRVEYAYAAPPEKSDAK